MNYALEAAKRILDAPDITFDGVTVQSVESEDAKIVATAYILLLDEIESHGNPSIL